MKVLIFGGSGFIGKSIALGFSTRGHNVTCFDLHHDTTKEEKNIKYIDGSIFEDDVFRLIDENDFIIHAICTISTNDCDERFMQGYKNDFIKTVEIFEYCSKKSKKIIFLSSGGTVYGNPSVIPTDELQPLNPLSHYGVLKVCVENVAHVFNRKYGLNIMSLRIANPYGPGQNYKRGIGFVDAVIRKSLENEEITIFGDGSIVRDYIYIEDLVRIVVFFCENNIMFEAINIGSGVGTSQNEIIQIAKNLGLQTRVKYVPGRLVDVSKNVLNISKLKSVYPHELTTLSEGMEKFKSFILKSRGEQNYD